MSLLLPTTKRTVTTLFIHCTATMPDMNIGVKQVRRWHKQRGWNDIGYHGLIRRDGSFEPGRPVAKIGAHAKGNNTGSIGIALVGGLGPDNRPAPDFAPEQWVTLRQLTDEFLAQYPGADIRGHNEVANKACPSFDVQRWLADGIVWAVA
jgi:N-acetyl-anhydromuramyl-L-alanine amidase AmpD